MDQIITNVPDFQTQIKEFKDIANKGDSSIFHETGISSKVRKEKYDF